MCWEEDDPAKFLLLAAEEIFGHVTCEAEPYNHPDLLVKMNCFRRFAEWQYEYSRSIRILYEADCLRGAIVSLRGLFEVTVAQVLFKKENDPTGVLEVLKGERVKIDLALKEIGWPCQQDDLYARLSKLSHPTRKSAYAERNVDFDKEPLKSLAAQNDLKRIAAELVLGGCAQSPDEKKKQWAFVALNTYDICISSLLSIYGESTHKRHFWSDANNQTFERIAEKHPEVKDYLLWFRLQFRATRTCAVDRKIKRWALEIAERHAFEDESELAGNP